MILGPSEAAPNNVKIQKKSRTVALAGVGALTCHEVTWSYIQYRNYIVTYIVYSRLLSCVRCVR
jgi:hypothetical protein